MFNAKNMHSHSRVDLDSEKNLYVIVLLICNILTAIVILNSIANFNYVIVSNRMRLIKGSLLSNCPELDKSTNITRYRFCSFLH